MTKKQIITIFFSFFLSFSYAQVKKGYEIQVNVKPYTKQWLYLGYHYGSIKGLADSAFVDVNGNGAFKGNTKLPEGIYILVSPTKSILFEILISKNQYFSIKSDSAAIDTKTVFIGSIDNTQFLDYNKFITPRAQAAEKAGKAVNATEDVTEKTKQNAIVTKNVKELNEYRSNFVKKYPTSLLAAIFKSMMDIKYPAKYNAPKNREDTIAMYQYGKEHYWDNINFADGRLVRTPIFDGKLKAYLYNWVSPSPDSIIYEFNWMSAMARNNSEMFKYVISYFVDNYINSKIMGQDKIFMHVYEKYFTGDKKAVSWLSANQLKYIGDRYYMLMANQISNPAWDMQLLDTTGKMQSLLAMKNKYTVIVFWDAHCGECKHELPRIDSLYKAWWKANEIDVYAVMVNEQAETDWRPFIRQYGEGWVHVHETVAMKAEEEKAGKPNFRQLYDMRKTPTLYLIDTEKKILAKGISLDDINNLLKNKFNK